jgi:3'(2'), 5'-bisphosphate nucleotidase
VPATGLVVLASRSHSNRDDLKQFLADKKVAEIRIGGSAIKFCRVAAGVADLYPRLGPTMEWDTAAGQAILDAAGGSTTTLDGKPFLYAKPGFLNTGFIARGR